MAISDEPDRPKASVPQPRPARTQTSVLTEEQLRRRRRRNVAIGLTVGFLALLFYVVTIVKLGPNVLNRPL